MKDLTGRTVVVTGAASGMGRSYAALAARRGARLALGDVDEAGLEETRRLLPPATQVVTQTYSVADRDATYAFADRVAAELGGAHVVINNAGIEGAGKPTWALTDAEIQRVLDVNFWGVVHGSRAFLPQLVRHRRAALVNVSSLFGLVGSPSAADYCAAKFAVRGFSEALSAELTGTGVRVHLVHPGGVATNINRSAGSQGFAEKYLRTDPDDVAREVLDALGTRRTRIVTAHRARSTYLGVRVLPQWLMARLVWRDNAPILDRTHYPATDHAADGRDA